MSGNARGTGAAEEQAAALNERIDLGNQVDVVVSSFKALQAGNLAAAGRAFGDQSIELLTAALAATQPKAAEALKSIVGLTETLVIAGQMIENRIANSVTERNIAEVAVALNTLTVQDKAYRADQGLAANSDSPSPPVEQPQYDRPTLQEFLDDLRRNDAQADEQLKDAQQNFQLSVGGGPRNYICTYGPCTLEEWEVESGVSVKKKIDDPCGSSGGGLAGILAAALCMLDKELAEAFDVTGSAAVPPRRSSVT